MKIQISHDSPSTLSNAALDRLFGYCREMLFSRHLGRHERDHVISLMTAIRMERRRRAAQRVINKHSAPRSKNLPPGL